MNIVDAKNAPALVSTATAADIETVIKRLKSLSEKLDKQLSVRDPIKATDSASTPHIRRAPLLRRRFE